MNNLYNACDLYISPYIAEGFNLAPLEALASGLPVIISSHGSTHEYITQLYESGGNKGFIHQLQTQTNLKYKAILATDTTPNLINGKSYTFNVKGKNSDVFSPASVKSTAQLYNSKILLVFLYLDFNSKYKL
jgi:hypothetical protein